MCHRGATRLAKMTWYVADELERRGHDLGDRIKCFYADISHASTRGTV